MPRTPLFGLVQRSLRVAQLARAREEPLDEVTDRVLAVSRTADTRATMSRRRFVAVSAAASAALALDACLPRRGSGTGLPAPRRDVEPVLIIGAGIAGLTAAYRLRQHGVPVRIIEAQQRVGGRMFSLRDAFADDQVCELGGELIDSNHASIRALAQELGIELDDLRQTDAGFDADVWWVGGARRTTGEVIRALAPVTAQLGVDCKAWPDDFDPTYHNSSGAQALDRMTIAEWLDRAGVSGWARELLDAAFTTEYGMSLDSHWRCARARAGTRHRGRSGAHHGRRSRSNFFWLTRRARRHEGRSLSVAILSLDAWQLRRISAGSVDLDSRCRRRAGGAAVLCGRALLARIAGIHERRLRNRGNGSQGDSRQFARCRRDAGTATDRRVARAGRELHSGDIRSEVSRPHSHFHASVGTSSGGCNDCTYVTSFHTASVFAMPPNAGIPCGRPYQMDWKISPSAPPKRQR